MVRDPLSHSLAWSIPVFSPFAETTKSGLLLMFTVGGDDVVGFYPVEVSFVGRGVLRVLGLAVCRRLAKGREEGR